MSETTNQATAEQLRPHSDACNAFYRGETVDHAGLNACPACIADAMANGEPAQGAGEYVLTWGMGGPDHTVTGLTFAEARDQARDLRPWGPVIMRLEGRGLFYMSGHRVAEGNRALAHVRSLGLAG